MPPAYRAPMAPPVNEDERHLDLLAIFHYVVGALIGLTSCVFIFHFVIGAALVFSPESMGAGNGQAPPPAFGAVFMILGGGAVLIGWTIAGLLIVAGRSLKQRTRHTLCCVAAAVACLWMPFGTVLGVLTLILLMKPEVRSRFS